MFKFMNRRDVIAGAVLLAASLIWIVLVYRTIDPAQGSEVGPRAFPLFFGVALAFLAALLALQGLAGRSDDDEASEAPPLPLPTEIWFVGGTIVLTLLYGSVMEQLGFIVSTAIFVAAVVVILLRIRRPLFVATMSVSLSLGAYVIFGKLLGTYLPSGTWISLQF